MVNKKTNLDKMDDALKDNLKDFFCNLCGEYGINNMKAEHYIRLKQILSDVNNIITMKATKAFVETLYKNKKIINNRSLYEKILDDVLDTKPNANGYDVQYDGTVGGEKFIAEVKCNIPNGMHFGGNKDSKIKEDIIHLIDGQKKKCKINTEDYFKFFVVMDCDNAKTCMEKIIKSLSFEYPNKILPYKGNEGKLRLDNVYVVYVKID